MLFFFSIFLNSSISKQSQLSQWYFFSTRWAKPGVGVYIEFFIVVLDRSQRIKLSLPVTSVWHVSRGYSVIYLTNLGAFLKRLMLLKR